MVFLIQVLRCKSPAPETLDYAPEILLQNEPVNGKVSPCLSFDLVEC